MNSYTATRKKELAIYLTDDEYALIETRAKEMYISRGAYIRYLVNKDYHEESLRKERKRREDNGRM